MRPKGRQYTLLNVCGPSNMSSFCENKAVLFVSAAASVSNFTQNLQTNEKIQKQKKVEKSPAKRASVGQRPTLSVSPLVLSVLDHPAVTTSEPRASHSLFSAFRNKLVKTNALKTRQRRSQRSRYIVHLLLELLRVPSASVQRSLLRRE